LPASRVLRAESARTGELRYRTKPMDGSPLPRHASEANRAGPGLW